MSVPNKEETEQLLKRLERLYDRLEWLRQKETDLEGDASLLMRTSHDPSLTDEYCDVIFDSSRRKLRIGNALSEVAKLIRKEREWAKIFTSRPTP